MKLSFCSSVNKRHIFTLGQTETTDYPQGCLAELALLKPGVIIQEKELALYKTIYGQLLSCLILSCLALPCLVVSCLALSFLVLSWSWS